MELPGRMVPVVTVHGVLHPLNASHAEHTGAKAPAPYWNLKSLETRDTDRLNTRVDAWPRLAAVNRAQQRRFAV
jgi:hypothetical protein